MSSAEISACPPVAEEGCYHCGLPVPAGSSHWVRIDDADRRMCCAGCEAVAGAIVSNGLTDYYRHRDAMPEPVREAMPSELQDLGLFDHPEFQADFVRPVGEHEREAALILEGITCAACVWLNERHVKNLPGVSLMDVNYATRRARVRWDTRQTQLSSILGAIQAIGYRAYPYDPERLEQVAHRERRSMLWRVFVAGFGMMQVMMYAYPAWIASGDDLSADAELLMRWASLILTLPVVFYSAAPFFRRAWRDLKLRALGMDVPVALGVGSAFLASVWATLVDGPDVYFDSVTMFVFLLLCGRYLEMLARQKAVRGVEELGKVLPAFVERLGADGAGERVPASQLLPGERVRVRPGEVIPVDGIVREGRSSANEALLTGESTPVTKSVGSEVIGGSINIGSPLVIEVVRVGEATRLAAIRRLIERAAQERPAVATQADRFARIFIAALLVSSVLTWVIWSFIDPSRALWIFVSVLVVACPCALSLATPTALTVATDALARMGILVTRGHAIEALAKANRFVFDKTGTLTHGEMRVGAVEVLAGDEADARMVAAALEQGSEHSVAVALRAAAGGLVLPSVDRVQAVTGQGVEGYVNGQLWRVGRPAFVAALSGAAVPGRLAEMEQGGATVVALGSAHGVAALFRLADTPREDAPVLIERLAREGVTMAIVSGDAPAAVQAAAQRLRIVETRAGATPEEKQAFVEGWQAEPGAVVAMVGDGVNDAPVLAQAQVSVAMGGGTDLARNQGDLVLLSNSLAGLSAGITQARRTMRIVRENLWWSFAYNFTSVPLAMAGFITPWMAGLGMALSSLLVVLNALRLQRRPATGA
jgi:P-type Cu2+ transporter